MTLLERLNAYMRTYYSPIEIGHAGEHMGIFGAMTEPYPTPDAVRAALAALESADVAAALEAITDLEGCCW